MFGILNDFLMKLRIRPSHSDWDNLNELFTENKETATENDIVMFGLFIIALGLIMVFFIVGISI